MRWEEQFFSPYTLRPLYYTYLPITCTLFIIYVRLRPARRRKLQSASFFSCYIYARRTDERTDFDRQPFFLLNVIFSSSFLFLSCYKMITRSKRNFFPEIRCVRFYRRAVIKFSFTTKSTAAVTDFPVL